MQNYRHTIEEIDKKITCYLNRDKNIKIVVHKYEEKPELTVLKTVGYISVDITLCRHRGTYCQKEGKHVKYHNTQRLYIIPTWKYIIFTHTDIELKLVIRIVHRIPSHIKSMHRIPSHIKSIQTYMILWNEFSCCYALNIMQSIGYIIHIEDVTSRVESTNTICDP